MMMFVAWILGIIVVGGPLAKSLPVAVDDNDDRSLVRCMIQDEMEANFLFQMVDRDGLDLWDHELPRGLATVTILATRSQLAKLQRSLSCQKAVPIKTIEAKIASEIISSQTELKTGQDFFANYRSYAEIDDRLQYYTTLNNTNLMVNIEVAGQSHEQRNISVITIAPAINPPVRKLWISCGQHAREWIAPAACMYFIDRLMNGYGQDDRITSFLNQIQVLVAPLVNPDGYEYSRQRDRYWRKNRRNNGHNRKAGVDLNRNWPNRWGFVGTSANPDSEIYKGPSAGSEPEVVAIGRFIQRHVGTGLVAGVDVHSFGGLVLRSFGWTVDPSPDEEILKPMGDVIADKMSNVDNMPYDSERSGELYPAAGAMDDWMYEKALITGMTFELRDKGRYGFLLPPNQIVPGGKELLEGILTLASQLPMKKHRYPAYYPPYA